MNLYILEPTKMDVTQLSRSGEVKYIFDNGASRPSIWATDKYIHDVGKRAEALGFDPSQDKFVIIGRQINVLLAVIALLRVYGSVCVMFFDARERVYVERFIGDYSNAETVT